MEKIIFSYSCCFYIERHSLPELLDLSTHFFVVGFGYSFCSVGEGNSSAVLCGPPIFVGNGNELSISSWLTTEVQVCPNVVRSSPQPPNLVYSKLVSPHFPFYFDFPFQVAWSKCFHHWSVKLKKLKLKILALSLFIFWLIYTA